MVAERASMVLLAGRSSSAERPTSSEREERAIPLLDRRVVDRRCPNVTLVRKNDDDCGVDEKNCAG